MPFHEKNAATPKGETRISNGIQAKALWRGDLARQIKNKTRFCLRLHLLRT